MRERPILFSTEMVKAIIEGRKTMTRRVIKPQPRRIDKSFDGTWEWKDREHYYDDLTMNLYLKEKCPYGQVGDRLWVKETYTLIDSKPYYKTEWEDDLAYSRVGEWTKTEPRYKWKSGRFMFKKYARLWLEITNIRVERLQDISLDDAFADGGFPHFTEAGIHFVRARTEFKTLWDSINAKRSYSWESNPFVWAIEFKKV